MTSGSPSSDVPTATCEMLIPNSPILVPILPNVPGTCAVARTNAMCSTGSRSTSLPTPCNQARPVARPERRTGDGQLLAAGDGRDGDQVHEVDGRLLLGLAGGDAALTGDGLDVDEVDLALDRVGRRYPATRGV